MSIIFCNFWNIKYLTVEDKNTRKEKFIINTDWLKETFLNLMINQIVIKTGYKCVGLWKDGHTKKGNLFIHHLVYISFKNDYDKNKVIDHIDGNKLNNDVNNPRCVTQSDNVVNAYKNNDNMNK